MSRNEGNILQANPYEAALKAITEIPQQLINSFTGEDVVNCLKTQYLSYLNELPFMFSAENDHVWQVLGALEAVLDNNYSSFSKDKKGDKLTEDIFSNFVSLAYELQKDKGLVKHMWIVVLLHDIAKYSVQNADHAQICGNLVRDLFAINDFALTEQERERIAWVIGSHDVVGNIVSSAERAPRCLTERLEKLSDKEKQIRLKMLILLSFCDLRGTLNGKFVNDENAKSRFWAADISWLEQKEKDLFGWRKERLVRASTRKDTEEKQELWNTTFSGLREETRQIIERQFGNNIKVFTNLLYLALGLNGEELVKLFAVISLMVEMALVEKPNPNFQVDFTKGAERDKPGPIIDGFKAVLKTIELDDLTLAKITGTFNGQTIFGVPILVSKNNLVIDSKKIVDEGLLSKEEQRSLQA
jgi:hypothetical protein